MIIERWEVIEYSFINVFLLTAYLIAGLLYIFLNHREKTWRKVLIHFIIGAIMTLGLTSTISLYSPRTIHMYYRYEDNADMIRIIQEGWDIIDRSPKKQVLHIKRKKE